MMGENVSEKQLVIFKIGKESFGVDIFEIREIIKHESITPVPETEKYVEGIINLRGNVIMLINLAKRLNIPFKEETKDTRTIVVETGDTFVGMRVDEVSRVLKISSDKIQTPPKAILEKIHDEFIEGVAVLNEELIIVLDLAKILNHEEISSLQEKNLKQNTESDNKEEITKEEEQKTKKEEKIPSEKKEEPKTKENKSLKESKEGFHFITLEGKELKNAKELHEYAENLSEEEFKNFVQEDKNDFYNWLMFGVKDEELAENIKNLKSKEDLTKEIIKYLHQII